LRYASPFLDRNFRQMAFTIPSNQKIRLGKEKYVLRRALRQLVPQEVVNIPKFPMIMKHDGTFSDALDEVADIVLSKERVERRGFMAFAEVRKLRQRRARGAYSSEGAMRLWTALLTEIWAETSLDLPGERPLALPPA
jgi:asparagine synthase (glutamine-hydrolysing)